MVLGLSTPLDDGRSRSTLAISQGDALRDPFREAMEAPVLGPTDWMSDHSDLAARDLRFNPATGLPMCETEIDVAGNPYGMADDDSSRLFN